MPTENDTIRLLLLQDSQNEAERLASLFRNAGHATRSQRADSPESLQEALQQPWDLLIAAPHNERLELRAALDAIHAQGIDLPCLQLVDNPSAVLAALQRGADDGIPRSADTHLLLAARRELRSLRARRAARQAERTLEEAEKRCQLLLDSSVNAIAYVHDGMHIHVNPAYAELFGYADGDDVACLPVIDLIESEADSELRDLLKNHQQRDGQTELHGHGRRADGSRFAARLLLSAARFEGEPCLQLIVHAGSDNAELEERLREASSLDPVTGLYNRTHLLDLLERQCAAAQGGSLALLRIDHYAQLLGDIGLADIDQLRAACATLLRERLGAETPLGRIADDTFAALLPDPAQAEALLGALLAQAAGNLFEVGARSVQLTLSIGVAPLERGDAQVAQRVLQRAHRCCEQVGDGNGIKLFDPAEELAAAASRGDRQAILQQALDGNAFELLFQPVVSLHGGAHEHYQASLQLRDAAGAVLPLAELLAAAGDGPLPLRVERWLLLQAMRQLAARRERAAQTRLFVDLGAASLLDGELCNWLGKALGAARLPGSTLILQFDEAEAGRHLKQLRQLAEGLAALGCGLALSGFGRHANALGSLPHLPVAFVRLAPELLDGLDEEARRAALGELIAGLRSQHKHIVAPGIDSAGMLTSLWQTGIHYVQGPYLQAPGPRMDYDFEAGQA